MQLVRSSAIACMPCIENMNQATWASCLSLLNLVASFLPHYLWEMKSSQNSQFRVSPTWDSDRYRPWCALQTKLLQWRCHCPHAWPTMSNLGVSQMLLSFHFNNSLVQLFLVFLSILLNDLSFPLGRKMVHKKLTQVTTSVWSSTGQKCKLALSQHSGLNV